MLLTMGGLRFGCALVQFNFAIGISDITLADEARDGFAGEIVYPGYGDVLASADLALSNHLAAP
jgi:hypothetical protein